MRKAAISFTDIIHGIYDKKLRMIDVDEFFFGCREDHLFREPGWAPMELAWLEASPSRADQVIKDSGVLVEDLTVNEMEVWKAVYSRVEVLREFGRCHFRDEIEARGLPGNYHALAVALLHKGYSRVWLNRYWRVMERGLMVPYREEVS